jgi:uncharacterized membrane protein
MKQSDPHSVNTSKLVWNGIYVVTLGVGVYYLVTRAFPMFNISEENYGAYYFPRAIWLFPHIVGGIIATLIGPFQFIRKFRDANLKRHRLLGKTYLLCVLFAGLTAFYLAATSDVNLPYMIGLSGLGFVWIATSGMAYFSIRKKKTELHREWMIRSYVVTFAFTTFRFFEDILMSWEVATDVEIWTLMSWACWSIPLFITEMIIQGKKV